MPVVPPNTKTTHADLLYTHVIWHITGARVQCPGSRDVFNDSHTPSGLEVKRA